MMDLKFLRAKAKEKMTEQLDECFTISFILPIISN